MSDFNGEPLVFRDDIEREFWGKMVASLFVTSPVTATGEALEASADCAVVAMRTRQGTITREIYENRSMVARRCCAVCLKLEGNDDAAGHAAGCPRGRR